MLEREQSTNKNKQANKHHNLVVEKGPAAAARGLMVGGTSFFPIAPNPFSWGFFWGNAYDRTISPSQLGFAFGTPDSHVGVHRRARRPLGEKAFGHWKAQEQENHHHRLHEKAR